MHTLVYIFFLGLSHVPIFIPNVMQCMQQHTQTLNSKSDVFYWPVKIQTTFVCMNWLAVQYTLIYMFTKKLSELKILQIYSWVCVYVCSKSVWNCNLLNHFTPQWNWATTLKLFTYAYVVDLHNTFVKFKKMMRNMLVNLNILEKNVWNMVVASLTYSWKLLSISKNTPKIAISI